MKKPEKPTNEIDRLNALKQLDVLDTPLNPTFERITRLTKKMLDVPMDALQDERFHDNPLVVNDPHIRFYAGYPIRSIDGFKIGSFCIMDHVPRDLSIADLEPLKDMAALVEQQLFAHQQKKYESKIMKELDKSKRDNLIDSLTRVWNREGLELNFQEHTTKAKSSKQYIALTIIDIDNFKHINDTYGHNAGDQVLREITKRILLSLDENDVLGRWGGEEFLSIIALKCDNPKDCLTVFEKARLSISKEPVMHGDQPIDVTASFGITFSTMLDADLTSVVAKADHALYQAKNSGKNKCVFEE